MFNAVVKLHGAANGALMVQQRLAPGQLAFFGPIQVAGDRLPT